MPKTITSTKIKHLVDKDNLESLLSKITGDINSPDGIHFIISKSEKFPPILKEYLDYRINLASVIFNLYEEAGSRALDDNKLVINPIKKFLSTYKKLRTQLDNTMLQDVEIILTFKRFYSDFKESQVISDAIIICSNLQNFQKVEDILPFKDLIQYKNKDLNFKFILKDIDEEKRKEILDLLTKLLNVTSEIHQLYNEPDIDPEEMFPLLMDIFDDFLGDLRRCNNAKKIIKNSSKLFKDNFVKYYKNFKSTGSPFGILEDFLIDVGDNAKGMEDTRLLSELRIIISGFKKKLAKKGIANIKVTRAMDMVENILDKFSNNDENKEIDTEELNKHLNDVMGMVSDIKGEIKKENNNNNA